MFLDVQRGRKHRRRNPNPSNWTVWSIKFREKCVMAVQEKARQQQQRLGWNSASARLAWRAITVGEDERIVQHDPWQCHASRKRKKERERVHCHEGRREKSLLILPYLSSKFVVDLSNQTSRTGLHFTRVTCSKLQSSREIIISSIVPRFPAICPQRNSDWTWSIRSIKRFPIHRFVSDIEFYLDIKIERQIDD